MDKRIDSIAIDLRALVQRNVATLYSHLVTRPTGRAVRLAIETQLAQQLETSGGQALSLVDLSHVGVLDFSCADEVVARLLAHYLPDSRPREAFFVFIGVGDLHRDPIRTVLVRHNLTAVAEHGGEYDLIGAVTDPLRDVWRKLESAGTVPAAELDGVFREASERYAVHELIRQRLVLHLEPTGGVQTLSTIARALR